MVANFQQIAESCLQIVNKQAKEVACSIEAVDTWVSFTDSCKKIE